MDSHSSTPTPQPAAEQQQPQRRRQQRLHLSCSECRRRKIRCDRAKPCHPCVRTDRGDRCHYDTPPNTPGRTVPGQLVFAARPAQQPAAPQPQRGKGAVQQEHQQPATPSAELQQHQSQHPRPPPPSSSLSRFDPDEASRNVAGYENVQPADAIPPLRQFWHGSKAGDQYVSPFDRRTITVPKEVVFGDNDATVFWGRSHEANFVPRVSRIRPDCCM